MSSTTDKIGGKIKQAVGNVTDDEELKTEGEIEETKGRVKESANDVADKVADAVDGRN